MFNLFNDHCDNIMGFNCWTDHIERIQVSGDPAACVSMCMHIDAWEFVFMIDFDLVWLQGGTV